ncbi:unnamed protein product [Arctia plantaginis]|uniref:Reverse transcriptase domain-containing protein n=1 Tax=Arctia plantaginis TaxID=874455 RepID=A0A8S1AHT7_ARCPL|nr:unnamed protein product [Arctia plantaginis]
MQVSESWLKPCLPSGSYSLPGFHLIRNDRSVRGGGGVAIYLRTHIPFSIVSLSSQPPPTDAGEHLFLEVELHHHKLLLGVYYSPSLHVNYFSSFEQILENLTPSYEHTIILGDFNTCLLKGDARSVYLRSVVESSNLSILPSGATHNAPNCVPSLLDLIIVSNTEHVTNHGQCSADEFSHHDLIYLSYALRPPKSKPKIVMRRSFGSMDREKLCADVRSIDWQPLLSSECIDTKVNILNENLINIFDIHAPLRSVKLKHLPAPWLTDEIRAIMSKKVAAKTRYKRRPTQTNFDKYVTIRNHCNKSGFRAGHSTVSALVHITDDIRGNMDSGNVTVLSLLDFSNAFNTIDFHILLGILRSLNISPGAIDWFHNYLFGRQHRIRLEDSLSSWCNATVGVPQGGVLSPLLFAIFINSISNHLLSSYHLYADDLQIYTHAPVSMLSTALNIINADLEHISAWSNDYGLKINPTKSQVCIIGSPIMSAKINWSHLPPVQFNNTIIPISSKVKNLGVIIDSTFSWGPQIQEVSREYNQRLYMCFIDFTKAFDSLFHIPIWDSLLQQGVNEKYLKLLHNIYSKCRVKVRLEKEGPEFYLQKGVRQGDPLSPKMFSAVLESIFRRLNWENIGLKIGGEFLNHLRFADDIVLFADNATDLGFMIDSLSNESKQVGLSLNASKTKIMSNGEIIDVIVDGNSIEYVKEYIYLGNYEKQRSKNRN